jgi:hypothetical protein
MTRSGALACLALALAPLAACASAPAEARPQRVAFVDYRNGTHLELVNETHTGRVEQYSEVRADASRKVQTDEVMQGLVEVLRERGFDRQARPGPAPRASDGQAVMALEIADGDRVEHVLGWRGMSARRTAFRCFSSTRCPSPLILSSRRTVGSSMPTACRTWRFASI